MRREEIIHIYVAVIRTLIEYIYFVIFLQTSTNVIPTKMHAPSQESVTIYQEVIGALVHWVGVLIIIIQESATSTWH